MMPEGGLGPQRIWAHALVDQRRGDRGSRAGGRKGPGFSVTASQDGANERGLRFEAHVPEANVPPGARLSCHGSTFSPPSLPARSLLRLTARGKARADGAPSRRRWAPNEKRPPEGGRPMRSRMSRRGGSQHVAGTLAAPRQADESDPGETDAEHRPGGGLGNRREHIKPLAESRRISSLVVTLKIPDVEVVDT